MSLIEQPTAKPEQRSRNGLFAPGNKIAHGRKLHARDRLSKAFITALADSFDKKGKRVIDQLADNDPAAYARLCASLLPKEVFVSKGPLAELTEQELSALAYAAQRLAASDSD
jgi:predicted NBD/HSP70 family sugar kinase